VTLLLELNRTVVIIKMHVLTIKLKPENEIKIIIIIRFSRYFQTNILQTYSDINNFLHSGLIKSNKQVDLKMISFDEIPKERQSMTCQYTAFDYSQCL
jgi:hypothetical protein